MRLGSPTHHHPGGGLILTKTSRSIYSGHPPSIQFATSPLRGPYVPGICCQFRRFICCDSVTLVDSTVPYYADSDLAVTAVCMSSLFNYLLAAEHPYKVRHF